MPPASADQPAQHPAPPHRPPAVHTSRSTKPERSSRGVAAADRRQPVATAPSAPAAAPPAPPPGGDATERTELTPEQIQRVLAGARGAFDACLRDAPRGADQPGSARQVTVRFMVAPEGTVSYPTIDDVTVSAAPMGQCLKAAARALTFPEFKGDPVKVDAQITIPGK
jgi:hypothetical protein